MTPTDLAALSAALDGVDERVRVHLLHLRDDLGPWSKQSADLITDLLAQIAALRADKEALHLALGEASKTIVETKAERDALRAERDEHAEALKVNNAVLCAALLRAKDAEAQIAALPAATVGVPLKQIGTGLYEQPAPNPAAIREAWEKAYWRMRSYAVHDNDCKLNKPPHFDGPCSCGLTAALEDALALIQMEEQK